MLKRTSKAFYCSFEWLTHRCKHKTLVIQYVSFEIRSLALRLQSLQLWIKFLLSLQVQISKTVICLLFKCHRGHQFLSRNETFCQHRKFGPFPTTKPFPVASESEVDGEISWSVTAIRVRCQCSRRNKQKTTATGSRCQFRVYIQQSFCLSRKSANYGRDGMALWIQFITCFYAIIKLIEDFVGFQCTRGFILLPKKIDRA